MLIVVGKLDFVRFRALAVTSVKKAVFSDFKFCKLVYIDRNFKRVYCHHLQCAKSQKIVFFSLRLSN
jgi:hypothetical protein